MKQSSANNHLAAASTASLNIITNFSRQASFYDQGAHIQTQAAQRLAKVLLERGNKLNSGSILEIGCGTGLLSKYLLEQFPSEQIYLLDPAANMLSICQENLNREPTLANRNLQFCPQYLECTVEDYLVNPDFATAKHAVIASSFTFQWLIDLPGTIKQLMNKLEKGGSLFFSYPISGSFPEWQASCRNLNLPFTANQTAGFTTLNSIIDSTAATIHCEEYFCQLSFADSMQFFQEMKMLGAHVKHSHPAENAAAMPLKAVDLRRLTRDWNKQFADKAINCTYKIIEGIITVNE